MSNSPWDEIDKIIEKKPPEEKEKWAKIGMKMTATLWKRALDQIRKEGNNGK